MSKSPYSKNVLVLGSAGQIGSALERYLTKSGYEVSKYDIASDPSQDLRQWPNDYLDELISKSQYVFFLAFDVGGSHYLEKYQDTFEFTNNNLRIMSNTFSLLDRYKTQFLFASSQMASMSYSNYGMLKQIGERMAKSIGGRVVHFWNVYGYESDFSKFHVVSDFIYNAIKYNQIKMRTNGLESRDFLYVEDCCEALKIVMENQEGFPTDMKIHIASGNFVQIIKLAELIAKELGATIEPGSSGDQVQRDARNAADLSIRDYWTPRTTLESGVKQIIEKMKTQINE